MRLRNRLLYETADILRLLSFKREAIERAIFTQDILDAKILGNKVIKSIFLSDRDTSNLYHRSIAAICKSLVLFTSGLEYSWYAYLKPLIMAVLAVIFGCLSIMLLYAQLANMIGIDINILYDIIIAPETNNIYIANVTITSSLNTLDRLYCSNDIYGICNKLRSLLA